MLFCNIAMCCFVNCKGNETYLSDGGKGIKKNRLHPPITVVNIIKKSVAIKKKHKQSFSTLFVLFNNYQRKRGFMNPPPNVTENQFFIFPIYCAVAKL